MSYHSPWEWTDEQFNGFKDPLKDLNIEYEVSSFERIIDFHENKYKSIGLDQKIAESGRKEDYSFIKTINKKFIMDFRKKGKKFQFVILNKRNEDNSEDVKKDISLKGKKEST